MSKPRLALVIGHNAKSGGAIRRDTGENEYSWNGRLAKMMHALAPEYGLETKIFRRKAGVSYYRQIKAVYTSVDRWEADGSIELHFNGSANPKANGVETLSSGSTRSLLLASAVQNEMVETIGLKDRGVKVRGRNQRGGLSLHKGRTPAIIGEPFFGSNRCDLAASDEDAEMKAIAGAYLRGAAKAFAAI